MWLLSHDLQVIPGWPQLSQASVGYSWGMFNDNVGFEGELCSFFFVLRSFFFF